MTDVTGFTPASTPPAVSITSTLSRTNSAAISAARSRLPPAQRYSIATVRPSIQPSSASRRTKAAVQALHAEDVAPPKIPTVGSFACCADAASGHAAAAPPSSDINARRFTAQYLPCVLTTERIPHLSYGRSLLRCGISSRSMTALGLGCVKTFWRGRTPASTNARIPGQANLPCSCNYELESTVSLARPL